MADNYEGTMPKDSDELFHHFTPGPEIVVWKDEDAKAVHLREALEQRFATYYTVKWTTHKPGIGPHMFMGLYAKDNDSVKLAEVFFEYDFAIINGDEKDTVNYLIAGGDMIEKELIAEMIETWIEEEVLKYGEVPQGIPVGAAAPLPPGPAGGGRKKSKKTKKSKKSKKSKRTRRYSKRTLKY